MSVSISDLKENLSKYLRKVRRGGEIQIVNRGVPVARLVGIHKSAGNEREQRLADEGVLRMGVEESLCPEEPLDIAGGNLSGALDEERGDRV
ncbi:MAG: hypothetical protein A2289_25755 [Deltaproteobacteria bacterium RIFOXYA12_FULL_58_15]|nr:MAG: hypothetical protein A2289_25755 [Deltaproteobacteria bacterium RIFOXYA12_FULL_58_15]OGR11221.1 MAG: hypothetical protein A2341_24895 [Deltaproteobacteria bacterium RIFOXYB12_FULL_58_9]